MDMQAIWISLKTSLVSTLLVFVICMYLVRMRSLSKSSAWTCFDILSMLPMALPPTVVGLFLLIFFGKNSIVGAFLAQLGLPVIFTWQAAVIASATVSFPIMYHSLKAAFEQVDNSLIETARIYGYSESRILWRVILPLASPSIAAGILLCFMRSIGEFGATIMLAGNIPGRTQTAPLAIFFYAESGEELNAIILSSVMLILSLFFISAMAYIRKRGMSHL